MKLSVKVSTNYGQRRIYPSCSLSKTLCDVFGIKSFTQEQVDKLKLIGFDFELKQEVI